MFPSKIVMTKICEKLRIFTLMSFSKILDELLRFHYLKFQIPTAWGLEMENFENQAWVAAAKRARRAKVRREQNNPRRIILNPVTK